MELFTLDRKFLKQQTIDQFHAVIWTERYYGDGEVELHVPATRDMIQNLKEGTCIGLVGTDEIMILETQEVEAGVLKVTGNTLLKWLNNRFVRTSPAHEDRYAYLSGLTPGNTMAWLVQYMAIDGPYLDGSSNANGIPYPQTLRIPGLTLGTFDTSGVAIAVAVPFGPLFDAVKIVGHQITLESATDTAYSLKYRVYKGLDRTSGQSVNTPVRFSPDMESLTDIKELRSITDFVTQVYSFAPANPEGLATIPGSDSYIPLGQGYTGFDLRALMIFAEDITTDVIGGSAQALIDILNTRAKDALTDHPFVKVIDGEIVPTAQFRYGVHYNLGDVIELQGYSGTVQNARVIEYIRTQDTAGERSYPSVSVMD